MYTRVLPSRGKTRGNKMIELKSFSQEVNEKVNFIKDNKFKREESF